MSYKKKWYVPFWNTPRNMVQLPTKPRDPSIIGEYIYRKFDLAWGKLLLVLIPGVCLMNYIIN